MAVVSKEALSDSNYISPKSNSFMSSFFFSLDSVFFLRVTGWGSFFCIIAVEFWDSGYSAFIVPFFWTVAYFWTIAEAMDLDLFISSSAISLWAAISASYKSLSLLIFSMRSSWAFSSERCFAIISALIFSFSTYKWAASSFLLASASARALSVAACFSLASFSAANLAAFSLASFSAWIWATLAFSSKASLSALALAS